MPAKATIRIAQLGEALHPGITTDPSWPTLAQQLYVANQEGMRAAELRRIATARPLPIDHPASALTYRLIDAIADHKPTTTTRAARATAKPTAPKIAPPEPAVRRPPDRTVRRSYEPPLPSPPPDYARSLRSQPRSGPRR